MSSKKFVGGGLKQTLSAIDVGSNAIRMMIASYENGRMIEIKKFRSPVRLGHEVFENGLISEKTLEAAVECFVLFAHLNQKYKVQSGRSVATSAVREAKNKNQFIKAILEESHIQIDVISGKEEAELIFHAVKNEIDLYQRNALLIDIGGGSVELTLTQNAKIKSTASFPLGTVRLLDHLKKRGLNEKSLKVLIGDLTANLSEHIAQNISALPMDFAVGTGGNLECMARLKLDLLEKTPNNYLTLPELVAISKKLSEISIQTRIEKLKLRPDRADVILPAILMVKTILRQSGINKIHIPCVGLRDGLLWSLI